WLDQLAGDGVLLVPLALAPGLAFVVRGTVAEGVFRGRLTRAAYFMPLRGEHEPSPTEEEPAHDAGAGHQVAAPWAGWFDRKRPRTAWLGFAQALACYGWVRGLDICY